MTILHYSLIEWVIGPIWCVRAQLRFVTTVTENRDIRDLNKTTLLDII